LPLTWQVVIATKYVEVFVLLTRLGAWRHHDCLNLLSPLNHSGSHITIQVVMTLSHGRGTRREVA
jgi:hypothetical protein